MKHRRGIDLGGAEPPGLTDLDGWRLDGLQEWDLLGAHCLACGHRNILDRWELQRRLGKATYLAGIRQKLRCTACGNHGSIALFTTPMPRNN
jgi:hypothetical protein